VTMTAQEILLGRRCLAMSVMCSEPHDVAPIVAAVDRCILADPSTAGQWVFDWPKLEQLCFDTADHGSTDVFLVVLLGGRPSGVRVFEVSPDAPDGQWCEFRPFDDDEPARDLDDDRYQAFMRNLQLTIDADGRSSEAWY